MYCFSYLCWSQGYIRREDLFNNEWRKFGDQFLFYLFWDNKTWKISVPLFASVSESFSGCCRLDILWVAINITLYIHKPWSPHTSGPNSEKWTREKPFHLGTRRLQYVYSYQEKLHRTTGYNKVPHPNIQSLRRHSGIAKSFGCR